MSNPQAHWSTTSTLLSSTDSSSPTLLSESWEKAHYLSLTLWDIDREFQKSNEAYQQWLVKNHRKRSISRFQCFKEGHWDDTFSKTLCLGRQVRALLEKGQDEFGPKFEQGDSTCTSILSAQLLRVQHEIRVPLEDCALARFQMAIPRDELLTAAKSIRRTCLQALRDQYNRLKSPTTVPFLPPPRFSVNYCPFALQLQKDGKKSNFQTLKVKRHDRHDDREICSYCNAEISVTSHTGLPAYRWILFQSHVLEPSMTGSRKTMFACTGCNKTFEDSYAFLDHVFQKEVGSERSCQSTWRNSAHWQLNRVSVEPDSMLVEKCLRNCLKRELTRARTLRKNRALEALGSDSNSSRSSLSTMSRALSDTGRSKLTTLSEDSMATLVEESPETPKTVGEWGSSPSIICRSRNTPFFHTRSTRSSFRGRY